VKDSVWIDPRAQVDPSMLREAMSRLVTGVAVVTARAPEGNIGLTVSSFTSVSLEPPTVLVCLNTAGRAYAAIIAAGSYAVNILGGSHGWLAKRFSVPGLGQDERFRDLDLFTSLTGSPLVEGTVAWLDCAVRHDYKVGTHGIVVAEVMAAGIDAGGEVPLAYYQRALEPFRTE
jgi:3-hydroxy-9,10-secoandrosta-1,3,5(10)-triene-9,17-dione monooxygenase reductase component